MAACAVCGKPVVTPSPTDDGSILHPKCAQLVAAKLRDKAKVKDQFGVPETTGSFAPSRALKR